MLDNLLMLSIRSFAYVLTRLPCLTGAVFTLKARAMDSLLPAALLLTQSLAGQLTEVVEVLREGHAAAPSGRTSAVAVH